MPREYERVIPRDIFNESKLLKCLGQLCLKIHDGMAGNLIFYHNTAVCDGFHIAQDQSDGSTFCVNLSFMLPEDRVRVRASLNSKEPYPLCAEIGEEEYEVFNDDGSFTDEFGIVIGLGGDHV